MSTARCARTGGRLSNAECRQSARYARGALELTRRLIVENGVAYNVYSDPQGEDRPWALDPLPLVISQDEWRNIEKGVAQRARALDALLRDLYGPQRLLAEGLVPPELPFGHPNFLWPCHGLVPQGRELVACLCGRPGARARWPLVAARGPDSSAFGSRVRLGESRHRRAGSA